MRKRGAIYEQLLEIIFTDFTSSFFELVLSDLLFCSSPVAVPVVPVALVELVAVDGGVELDELLAALSLPVTVTLCPTWLSRSAVFPSSFHVAPGVVGVMPVVPVAVDVPAALAAVELDAPMPVSMWALARV